MSRVQGRALVVIVNQTATASRTTRAVRAAAATAIPTLAKVLPPKVLQAVVAVLPGIDAQFIGAIVEVGWLEDALTASAVEVAASATIAESAYQAVLTEDALSVTGTIE
jgi:hypothetical protein